MHIWSWTKFTWCLLETVYLQNNKKYHIFSFQEIFSLLILYGNYLSSWKSLFITYSKPAKKNYYFQQLSIWCSFWVQQDSNVSGESIQSEQKKNWQKLSSWICVSLYKFLYMKSLFNNAGIRKFRGLVKFGSSWG